MSLPESQKAWIITAQGHPSKVIKLQDVPIVLPTKGQALVKVEAAALNPVTFKLTKLVPSLIVKRPRVADSDFTGVVVDPNGTSFKKGDKVAGLVFAVGGNDTRGSVAEYICATEDEMGIRPAHLDVETSAGLGVVGLTAYIAIFEYLKVQPGQNIFVVGGSSSLGSIACQMLVALGCTVSTSCSTRNIDLVKSLGVTKVYDYSVAPVQKQLKAEEGLKKFDGILDCIGGYDLYKACPAFLVQGGQYISPGSSAGSLSDIPSELYNIICAYFWPAWLGGTPRTYKFFGAATTKELMTNTLAYIGKHKIKPLVDSSYSLEDGMKAIEKSMSGRAKGKVVIKIAA